MTSRTHWFNRVIVVGALLLSPALAQAAAAQILFSLNRVEIQRGEVILPALRGAAVEVGDTLNTGPNGYAQVRFKDGALMSLKPGASLKIEDYALPAAAPATATPVSTSASVSTAAAPSGGRSVLRLLRGAFRTITGAIGKNANDVYRVVTPTATIGIRGTDYSAAYCESNCGKAARGLYVGVSNGQIFVSNAAGELALYDNQYAYVQSENSSPEQTLAPPDVLETPIDGDESDETSDDKEDAPTDAPTDTSSDDSGPTAEESSSDGGYAADDTAIEKEDTEGTYELQPGEPGVFAFAIGPFQNSNRFAGAGLNGVYTNEAGELIAMLAADTMQVTFYSIGSSQNKNQGFDLDTGLRWGRWSGGTADVGGQALDLSNRSLHWIYAAASDTPVIPVTGSASYTLIGNTDPTDNNGNVGFLGSANFSANFTNQTVNSSLDLGINNQVWQASGSGSIISGAPLFAGTYSVSINDALGAPLGSGTGDFAGFFTDGAVGAGLSYSLENGSGTTVSGAAAFVQPVAPAQPTGP